jgi:hypothetical protein
LFTYIKLRGGKEMADVKLTIKGKGKDFAKNPEKFLKDLGVLSKGEELKVSVQAPKGVTEAAYACKHGCVASVEAESEAD